MAVPRFAAELFEVLARQIDTSVRDVFTHVAKDVPELEGDSELVGERRGKCAVGAVEDAERQPADRARDAPAVQLELGERDVLGAEDVHLGAVDELPKGRDGDGEASRGVGEGDEHRVHGLV